MLKNSYPMLNFCRKLLYIVGIIGIILSLYYIIMGISSSSGIMTNWGYQGLISGFSSLLVSELISVIINIEINTRKDCHGVDQDKARASK